MPVVVCRSAALDINGRALSADDIYRHAQAVGLA